MRSIAINIILRNIIFLLPSSLFTNNKATLDHQNQRDSSKYFKIPHMMLNNNFFAIYFVKRKVLYQQ